MIRRLWTWLKNTSTTQRVVMAFVIGYLTSAVGISQIRFLVNAIEHGGI